MVIDIIVSGPLDQGSNTTRIGKFLIPLHCNFSTISNTEDNEDYDMVSNLSCPKCHTIVDVYHPSNKLIKEYEDYEKKKK